MTKKLIQWIVPLFLAGVSISNGAARNATTPAEAPAQAATQEVKIDNFSFAPQTITIPVGTTIHWTNRDDIPHTVVSEDKTTFKSKVLDTDQDFAYTFSQPGTFNYFCSVHPKMTATVVVK